MKVVEDKQQVAALLERKTAELSVIKEGFDTKKQEVFFSFCHLSPGYLRSLPDAQSHQASLKCWL